MAIYCIRLSLSAMLSTLYNTPDILLSDLEEADTWPNIAPYRLGMHQYVVPENFAGKVIVNSVFPPAGTDNPIILPHCINNPFGSLQYPDSSVDPSVKSLFCKFKLDYYSMNVLIYIV